MINYCTRMSYVTLLCVAAKRNRELCFLGVYPPNVLSMLLANKKFLLSVISSIIFNSVFTWVIIFCMRFYIYLRFLGVALSQKEWNLQQLTVLYFTVDTKHVKRITTTTEIKYGIFCCFPLVLFYKSFLCFITHEYDHLRI